MHYTKRIYKNFPLHFAGYEQEPNFILYFINFNQEKIKEITLEFLGNNKLILLILVNLRLLWF